MQRFWSKVEITGLHSCWNWTAGKSSNRYGVFYLNSLQRAHRVAYTLIHGEIPEGYDVHHKCENRGCVNPMHLETIEHAQHKREHQTGWRKTHCKRGHERTPENVRANGHCKPCARKNNGN